MRRCVGICPVCGWEGVLRRNMVVRTHDDGSGGFCDGAGRTDPKHIREVTSPPGKGMRVIKFL